MKKYFISIIAISIWFMVLPTILYPQEEHKKIVEEVSVNWWQVPVFAVDEKGNPVTDLEPEDIEIIMNHRVIPTFTLGKRTFNVTERSQEVVSAGPAAAGQPSARNKVVILLFDLTLSGESAIGRARIIAQTIITGAEKNTQFIVMTIESLPGLVYIGEGSSDQKDHLLNMIKNEVKAKKNARWLNLAELIGDLDSVGGGMSKFEGDDIPLFREVMNRIYKRKNIGFFYAFETLYFFLNAIEDNKFIYFFSEGMSSAILGSSGRSLTGEQDWYIYNLQRVGKYLSRCGAVLFVINSMGVIEDADSPFSGENSLNALLEKSGGTYLEGTQEKITERLTNIHQAYYEVSFPDDPQFKGKTREITIHSKRDGIKIHTLHSLEKRKPYTEMIPIEKEMLVLNLVTQPDNSLIKARISPYNARIIKTKKSKKSATYSVTLPPGYLYKTIEMFKVFLAIDSEGTAQVEKIEKESLYPKQNRLDIQFQPGKEAKAAKDKKEKETGETMTYFVLVNPTVDPTRALVHGISYYDEDPELEEQEKIKTAKKTKGGETIAPQEMQRILQGAADYCERLKQSAFHFYCRETISEVHNSLSRVDLQSLNVTLETQKRQPDRILDQLRTQAKSQAKKCEFGYRLFKQGNNIKEERDYISSSDEIKVRGDQVITANAFFAERTVFGPVTILDSSRQENFDIRFVEFAEYKNRPAVVIEALPKKPAETPGVYGKIWIARGDFSVLKIEANPQSIRGFDKLLAFAKKLNTKLHLTLETEFDEIYKGLRFPTKVRMSEKYKGGPIILQYQDSWGWERTVTEFLYTDYQFFDVQTEVTVRK